jgi:hypothetical protein
MQPDHLDEALDLRLCALDTHAMADRAQPARDHREIDDQRGVGEDQPGQVDQNVRLDLKRTRQRAAPAGLRGTILISGDDKNCRFVAESDDARTLARGTVPAQGNSWLHLSNGHS